MTPSRIGSRLFSALVVMLFASRAGAQSANTPLLLPSSVVYDSAGTLYFAETDRHVVRRLNPAGVLTVVAGTGTQGYGGDSGPATAALLDSPTGLAVDNAGDLFFADTHNHRIRRIDAVSGIISTYTTATLPVALAFNANGALVYADAAMHQIFLVDQATGQATVVAGSGVEGFSGDGGLATAAALDTPSGLAYDRAGDLFVADAHNHRVRRIDAITGMISTVAGSGEAGFSGDAMAAGSTRLDLPRGLTVDASGNLFLADSRNQRIRRVDGATGVITTVAGSGTQGFLGDGSPAVGASLDTPRAITLSLGALPTIADSANNRVRQVDGAANIQTIAGVGAVLPALAASTTTLTQASATSFVATVSAAAGPPTGTATLMDGTTSIASAALTGGGANLAAGNLSAGTHTLTASYSGNSVLLPSSSPPLIVTVGSAVVTDFTLTAGTPTSVTVASGSVATFNFAVALTGAALSSPINLAVTGAPSGAASSFNPALIPPPSGPSTFTLTIDTPASARVEQPGGRELPFALACAVLLLPVACGRRCRVLWLPGLLLLSGCGTRIYTGNTSLPPPVTYNVTVSGTATSPTGATLVHTAQVTLVVD